MDEWITTLNANSGAIVAVTATVSAVLTILLLLEARTTRNLRREATVEARAKAYPPASFLLQLEVRNFGPANARNVVVEHYLIDAGGNSAGDRRRHADTLLGPGEGRKALPTMASGDSTLSAMATANLTLHVEWSWNDDRRRLWFLPLRHERKQDCACADLAKDFFAGYPLTERDPEEDLHLIAEKVKEIERHQKAGRRTIDRGVNAFIRAIDGLRRPELDDAYPRAMCPWSNTDQHNRHGVDGGGYDASSRT